MKRDTIRSVFMCVIGAFIFAIAINTFSIPNSLGEGGVTGIGLMLYYVFQIPVAVTNIILNGFILFIGYRYLDRRTMRYTIFATVLSSIFLQLTYDWGYVMDIPILAPICSGAFIGAGIGLIMQAGGSTAGTDIIALIMNKFLGWSTSAALVVLDILIVFPSIFIIGLENLVLTVVHLYVQTKVLNFILEGFNPKKSVMIISEKPEEIAKEIDRVIGRGITYLHAQGYFLQDDKKVVMVIINRQQIMPLNKIINAVDPKAFVILSEVQNVVGEGFSYIVSDEEYQNKIKEFTETGKNTASTQHPN